MGLIVCRVFFLSAVMVPGTLKIAGDLTMWLDPEPRTTQLIVLLDTTVTTAEES